MTLTHCPRKNLTNEGCASCPDGGRSCSSLEPRSAFYDESLSLLDGRGAKFPLRRYKVSHCYWELLNGTPLDNREVLCRPNYSVLIDLTAEPNPTEKLREIFSSPHSHLPHTHGNYKRPVR